MIINQEVLIAALSTFYNLENCRLHQLVGYDSTNFLITRDTDKFLLKVYNLSSNDLEAVDAENKIMIALTDLSGRVPQPLHNSEGDSISILKEEKVFLRLLSYLNGEVLANVEQTDTIIKSIGSLLGRLDNTLRSINNAVVTSKKTTWDLSHFLKLESNINFIDAPDNRKLVAYFIVQWKTFVIDKLHDLRTSIIHNDANDYNIIVDKNEDVRIIDFGDMVDSYLINEIAISASYIAMDKEDPINVIAILLKGYHEQLPLLENEVDMLYYLIAGRLCTSVLHSAKAKLDQPDKDYISISEKGAWNLLRRWIRINPTAARATWRGTLGWQNMTVDNTLLEKRKRLMPNSLSISYDNPIHMHQAAFQYMYDSTGHTMLDAYNNIIQVGHSHPNVVTAGQNAMAKLNTNTRYLYDGLINYASLLLSYFPNKLNKVFFVNSGSAASDLALRLARAHTGNIRTVVLEHGYHGNTSLGIDISHYKYSGPGGFQKKRRS